MIYIALLRGINVGGKNKVDMKLLRRSFESIGMDSVQTYINSGNIIFSNQNISTNELADILEKVIIRDFGLRIRVLVRSFSEIQKIIDALPSSWQNNTEMKSDVLFLWEEIDNTTIIDQIKPQPGIDTMMYIPGTLFWSIERKNKDISALVQFSSKSLSRQTTIRNVNTVRKIYEMMQNTKDSL